MAGVIVEPDRQHRRHHHTDRGILPYPSRQICDRYNVTLIFDEVITGFAKTGRMFAAQTYGVTPDIICTGKGISGGAIPLGADDRARGYGGSILRPGSAATCNFAHGHTFAGNPAGLAP